MMKLMSPWLCRVTFFERCRATAGNPMLSNSRRNNSGSGAAYSTNSNPSVRIGLAALSSRAHDETSALSRTRMAVPNTWSHRCVVTPKLPPFGEK